MITKQCRPKTFEEMAGQDLNIRILRAIAKKPTTAPKSIIMQGEYGSGKTTSARILAKLLNCEESQKDPCLKCKSCLADLESSPFYAEYDAAIIGNVEKIRELRDTFYYSVSGGYKVIIFDEVHLASRQAQSALLKTLEESTGKVFFIFCTTEVEKIIPTIRSRSLELRFDLVGEEQIIKNLKRVCQKFSMEVSEDILSLIAVRSRGHMRNAHMFLDQYQMIGEEDFRQAVRTSKTSYLALFESMAQKNKEKAFKSIDTLLTFPLADLEIDFQTVLLDLVKVLVGYREGSEKEKAVVKLLGADTLKLVKQSKADWVLSSFESDVSLQACLLSLYQMVSSSVGQQKPQSQNNLLERARKK